MKKGDVEKVSTLDLVVLNGPNIALQDIDEDGKIWAGINGEILKVDWDSQGKLTTTPIAECLKFEPGTYISDFLMGRKTRYGFPPTGDCSDIIKAGTSSNGMNTTLTTHVRFRKIT